MITPNEERPIAGSGTPGDILALVRSGAAASRSELVRATGLAASTVSTRVEQLVTAGYVQETGTGPSSGGRPPRRLQLHASAGAVAVADLGTHHATFGLLDLDGRLLATKELGFRIDDGPAVVLTWVHEQLTALAARELPKSQPVRGITIGLPGPVAAGTGRVVSPSRMPGWHGADVPALMRAHTDLPVLVDNDANLMAVGEHAALADGVEHLIFLKAGTGIGCGVIASGRLHHGAGGAAGDISHVRVAGAPDVPCSCGRSGCLDAVASGAALVRQLESQGIPVEDTTALVARAADADPTIARWLRDAGRWTGQVLAPIVNFFNPDALVIGGQLSQAEPFVASIRSALYQLCLPMAVQDMQTVVSRAGTSAGVLGAGRLMIDHVLEPARVNAALAAS